MSKDELLCDMPCAKRKGDGTDLSDEYILGIGEGKKVDKCVEHLVSWIRVRMCHWRERVPLSVAYRIYERQE